MVCDICRKPKRVSKTKRGVVCSRCQANLQILTDWLTPNREHIVQYLGRLL